VNFSVDIEQPDKSLPPVLRLRADDERSGVAGFRVQVGDRDAAVVKTEDMPDGTYRISPILPGTYALRLAAIDRAGNETSLDREFKIDGVDHVTITESPGFHEERFPLIIQGTADWNAKVTVKVETEGRILFEEETHADYEGKWTLVTRRAMKRGDYQVSARMFTRAGAASEYTEKRDLVVTNAPFINRFGWIIIVILILAVVGLSLYITYLRKRELEKRLVLEGRTAEIKEQAEAIFAALDEEVEEKIRLMDEETATKLGAARMSGLDVVEKIKEALDISQDTLNKEIQDVRQELEE
jgi:hypothetical protein